MGLGEQLATIFGAIRTLLSLTNRYRKLLRRASAAPGLPSPESTEPYWLRDPPFPELTTLRDPLPATADVVIIGSGIAAAATAHAALELEPDLRVVVVEARQLCSGATGRNGGHVKVVPHEELARLARRYGHQTARRLVRFQLMHLPALLRLGGRYPEAEVREVETTDFFLDVEDLETAKRHVEAMRPWLPDVDATVLEGEEARCKAILSHIPSTGAGVMVAGAVSYKAGALWPYRLVTAVWNELRTRHADNLTIRTLTPVEAVEDDGSSLLVRCGNGAGTIAARNVVHATNAFASQLVPVLRGRLTGVIGHMTAQRPCGPTFPTEAHGLRSWSVIYPSSEGFDYATQRPDRADGSPGDVMLGGGLFRSRDGGLDQMGVWDDSRLDAFPLMHLRGSLSAVFQPGGGSNNGGVFSPDAGAAWSGIMGFTGDSLPLVGRLPERRRGKKTGGRRRRRRQWVVAGFNGEGMVWAWLCGAAVGVMLVGRQDETLPPGEGGRRGGSWLSGSRWRSWPSIRSGCGGLN
ncbi:hypothetical protein L249_1705 [Ophiocordyceps polyrhachis-furcata BCC 54312]|uniref:FAD dependent oxidoreductase domain-containing protein n=1 Tax=Ophiocordyceps polyrhachis-furcata BCC 54312 TaxID=1330021 RepID=A0A367LN56_9HYPO|nr:hypothetical protein L249_1705 [Ophiocordyceps polyrhachis-furcata BCC 54312]